MDEFIANLKRQIQDNPLLALAAAGAILTGASKILNASSWRMEVARRAMKDARK